ncbi:MAG: 50S ribosomal protein L10 [Candidatus Aenigmarchaeota archaeon]|nr:50S ribosomal protein L10 [Candidatus Aenigmarchaeota archaeon]
MVKEEKIKKVGEMEKLLTTYKTIGIIDLHKLPNKQMQEIKKSVRGTADLKVVKKSTLLHALKKVSWKIGELEKSIPLQPGLVLTNADAFKFYIKIDKLKSLTFAKEGDVVGEEILITAGPTSLLPGPVISEFAKVGLVAGVEDGKVAIKRDKVVAKKGDVVSKELAPILRKLKIQTIKVGLNIVAMYDDGFIYKKDSLSLVGDSYLDKIKDAFHQALNLSVNIIYPTKENIGYIFAKAYQQAKAIQNKIGV